MPDINILIPNFIDDEKARFYSTIIRRQESKKMNSTTQTAPREKRKKAFSLVFRSVCTTFAAQK